MVSNAAVQDFVAQRKLALVGASSKKAKFGNFALKDLRKKGYKIYPVHPQAKTIEGEPCFSSLAALPEAVDGLLVVVPPAQTEQVVRDAAAAGIKRVWMQQGAESAEAIQFCQENGVSAVHGECILMFAEPAAWFHRAHRWVWKLLGKLPR
jgi:predicted CoA-binding protein